MLKCIFFLALTRSRDNFRQEFPNAPQSSDMLEVQQRELIRQQERELLKLRQGQYGSTSVIHAHIYIYSFFWVSVYSKDEQNKFPMCESFEGVT